MNWMRLLWMKVIFIGPRTCLNNPNKPFLSITEWMSGRVSDVWPLIGRWAVSHLQRRSEWAGPAWWEWPRRRRYWLQWCCSAELRPRTVQTENIQPQALQKQKYIYIFFYHVVDRYCFFDSRYRYLGKQGRYICIYFNSYLRNLKMDQHTYKYFSTNK